MRELRVHVERAVRPVRAFECRKLRTREELLAHLTSAYEEERACRSDDREALAEALRRFGEPAELTRELQASVPALERALCMPLRGFDRLLPVGRLIWEPPGLSGRRRALRQAAATAGFAVAPALALASLRLAWEGVPGGAELLAWAGCLAAIGAAAFAFMLLCSAMSRALDAGRGVGSAFQVAGYAVPAAALLLAAMLLFQRVLLGEAHFETRRLVLSGGVLLATAFSLAAALRGAAVGRRRLDAWANLDLVE
jgi:hypothetical protein